MAMTLEYFELTEKYTQQYGEKSILFIFHARESVLLCP